MNNVFGNKYIFLTYSYNEYKNLGHNTTYSSILLSKNMPSFVLKFFVLFFFYLTFFFSHCLSSSFALCRTNEQGILFLNKKKLLEYWVITATLTSITAQEHGIQLLKVFYLQLSLSRQSHQMFYLFENLKISTNLNAVNFFVTRCYASNTSYIVQLGIFELYYEDNIYFISCSQLYTKIFFSEMSKYFLNIV